MKVSENVIKGQQKQQLQAAESLFSNKEVLSAFESIDVLPAKEAVKDGVIRRLSKEEFYAYGGAQPLPDGSGPYVIACGDGELLLSGDVDRDEIMIGASEEVDGDVRMLYKVMLFISKDEAFKEFRSAYNMIKQNPEKSLTDLGFAEIGSKSASEAQVGRAEPSVRDYPELKKFCEDLGMIDTGNYLYWAGPRPRGFNPNGCPYLRVKPTIRKTFSIAGDAPVLSTKQLASLGFPRNHSGRYEVSLKTVEDVKEIVRKFVEVFNKQPGEYEYKRQSRKHLDELHAADQDDLRFPDGAFAYDEPRTDGSNYRQWSKPGIRDGETSAEFNRRMAGESDESHSEWKEVDCKSVEDSDGFFTDYTWYTNGKRHIFIFGDKEIYGPDDYPDWEIDIYEGEETKADQEAQDWFTSYKGFAEDEDDGAFEAVGSDLERAVQLYLTEVNPYGSLNSPFEDESQYVEELKRSFSNPEYLDDFIEQGKDNQEFVEVCNRLKGAGQDLQTPEFDIETSEQEFTSEKTSVNSSKLPAIFNLVNFKSGTVNLDYGGGRFDNATEFLAEQNVKNLVYDPYNRSAEHNKSVLAEIRERGGADTVTCSNVLNVIKEENVRNEVIRNIYKLLKNGGVAYFTVYEGSGSGEGRPTSAGFQLNRKTSQYLDEIQSVFRTVQRKGKLIIAMK